MTWAEFESADPELAALGRALLTRSGTHALLATVRGDRPPRIHPVTVAIVEGRLYTFIIERSAKGADLGNDGRFAVHAVYDPESPNEFSIRGRAHRVDDPTTRDAVAAGWAFNAGPEFALFELLLDGAIAGLRDGPDEWPPRYRSWSVAS